MYRFDGPEPKPEEGRHVEGAERPKPPHGELPEVTQKEAVADLVRVLRARGDLWRLTN